LRKSRAPRGLNPKSVAFISPLGLSYLLPFGLWPPSVLPTHYLHNMRVACLQFAPELGKPVENTARANEILEAASLIYVDLLVLPELAFTGLDTCHPALSGRRC